MSASPRVGVYALGFPKTSQTWAVNKVVGLIDAGMDVQVFCRWEGQWDRFQVFRDRPELRERVHFLPAEPGRPWSARSAARVTMRFATTIRRHPRSFVRFVVHNWKWRHRNVLGFWSGLYDRLPFVGQSIDILHLELDTMAPRVADIKEFLGCQLVLSGRSTLQYTGKPDEWPGGYDSLFKMADLYHVECDYTRKNLRHLGLDNSVPIALIPSAVAATELFAPDGDRPLREPDEIFRILSVGRLAVEKGHEFALDAVARLHRAGLPVTYTIVGQGAYEEAIRFAAHQLGLVEAGVVRFAGTVARESVADFYREADVLLHASTDEGVSNVLIEAQAMELAVVASAAAG
ncbi:MAG TPA: glycosyltransferase, partial [Ilumatobacter sp.]|nr:glycosyltransferase [Ilumatobacter sp.]